ncbi:hypothetical protein LbFV_ORF35 [Leptopilina boulardi filamentous virus]|uniref:Uncharacterized protein n=1 Tax=Leptopilina boulardi filamentous virus TaxID=552509 RepID=A0A1S5YD84_9VIRU|nr:hypothetical protein LbFV_ORF35 [Leptopilina boulardi filamentous virus]AQQ79955.1 hypothetical protein LbFV_ORF35 [Leptopilina boulardi filamentous virus]
MDLKFLLSQTTICDNIVAYLPQTRNLSLVCKDFRHLFYKTQRLKLKRNLHYKVCKFKKLKSLEFNLTKRVKKFCYQLGESHSSIQKLCIEVKSVVNFDFIKKFTNLTELYLYNNSTSFIPKLNYILDIKLLSKKLKILVYDFVFINGNYLINLENLEYLSLNQNHTLTELKLPLSLKSFEFKKTCESFNFYSFNIFADLKKIKFLNISNFYGTLECISSTNIECLILESCVITDFSRLSFLINLKEFYMKSCYDRNPMVKNIIFPENLEKITLYSNNIHCIFMMQNIIFLKMLLINTLYNDKQQLYLPKYILQMYVPKSNDYCFLNQLTCRDIIFPKKMKITRKIISYLNTYSIESIECHIVAFNNLCIFPRLKYLILSSTSGMNKKHSFAYPENFRKLIYNNL